MRVCHKDSLRVQKTLFGGGFITRNFQVLCTYHTLARPWCCGEVVTAMENNIAVCCIHCPNYKPFDEHDFRRLVDILGYEGNALVDFGITLEMVEAAYRRGI